MQKSGTDMYAHLSEKLFLFPVQQKPFFSVFINMKSEMTQLVKGCCNRDPKSQRRLYEMFAPNMLALCMNYTGSKADAEDVLHDGFVKIFERIHTLRNPELLPVWIKRIMRNCAVSYVVSQRKKGILLLEEVVSGADDNLDGCAVDYVQYDKDEIFAAIQQLPESYKVVFTMREIDGYEYEEIARVINAPQNTVRSLLCRAKKKLKQYLSKI